MFKLGIIILLSVSLLGITGCFKEELAAIKHEEIPMESVPDGTYCGEAKIGPVFVKVEVSVAGHQIIKIGILEHQNGLGRKAEAITESIVAQNSSQVDAISGATVSSEAIKYAVNKALQSSINQDVSLDQ